MGFAGSGESQYNMLKEHIDQVDLRKLLKPNFYNLLEKTVNSTRLAYKLFKKGVMTTEELDECMGESMPLYQNLEVYRAVKKRNAGAALIDALYETENFFIIRCLVTNLEYAAAREPHSKQYSAKELESKSKRTSILWAPSKITKPVDPNDSNKKIMWNCLDTIGQDNLSSLREKNFDWTLVRVVTTSDTEDSREVSCNSDLEEKERNATISFLESQLELDRLKSFMASPPRQLYINSRSFHWLQWVWLTKLLHNYCWDSLEHLWLDEVDYTEFCRGTEWMEDLLEEERKPQFWFSKLKVFIFQVTRNLPDHPLNSETFHSILGLIKSPNYSFDNLWNFSCQIQIWDMLLNSCLILMDPPRKTLFFLEEGSNLRSEIDHLLKSGSKNGPSSNGQSPITKLFYTQAGVNLFTNNSANLGILTHLAILPKSREMNHQGVLQEVLKNLSQLKGLQKLMFHGCGGSLDLNLLDTLENLAFLSLDTVKIGKSCDGFDVVSFPWRTSVHTIILSRCEFSSTSSTLKSVEIKGKCVKLERIRRQNDDRRLPSFNGAVIAEQDYYGEVLREFFS